MHQRLSRRHVAMRHLLRSAVLILCIGLFLPVISAQVAAKDPGAAKTVDAANDDAGSGSPPADSPLAGPRPSPFIVRIATPRVVPLNRGTRAGTVRRLVPSVNGDWSAQSRAAPRVANAISAQAGAVVTVNTAAMVVDGNTTNVTTFARTAIRSATWRSPASSSRAPGRITTRSSVALSARMSMAWRLGQRERAALRFAMGRRPILSSRM